MNWGHKLTITICIFVSFMAYMLYRCITTEFQLVEKEYYKSELKYQQVINGSQNAKALSGTVQVYKQNNEVVVQLPDEMKQQPVSGNLWFYCAYDASMDRKMAFTPNENGNQSFQVSGFKKGAYTVKIEWSSGNEHYYTEQSLNL